MLPRETADAEAESAFGIRLAYLSILWILATVGVGIFLIAIRPLLS